MPVIKETQKCHKRIRSCTDCKAPTNWVKSKSKLLYHSKSCLWCKTPSGKCKTELRQKKVEVEKIKLLSSLGKEDEKFLKRELYRRDIS